MSGLCPSITDSRPRQHLAAGGLAGCALLYHFALISALYRGSVSSGRLAWSSEEDTNSPRPCPFAGHDRYDVWEGCVVLMTCFLSGVVSGHLKLYHTSIGTSNDGGVLLC